MKYVLDMHCHTIASGHAYSTIGEYANEAARMGLELIAITDHGPKMPNTSGKSHFANLKVIPDVMNGVKILSGVELNILNIEGDVDLRPALLKNLSVIIASLHVNVFEPGNEEENTLSIINTMKNPYVKIIGHLGDPRYPINIEKVVTCAGETNTIIEINNSSLDPNSFRAGSNENIKQIALCCIKQGLPMVIGSDSHFHTYLGKFDLANDLLAEISMPKELILNTQTEAFLSALELKKPDESTEKEN